MATATIPRSHPNESREFGTERVVVSDRVAELAYAALDLLPTRMALHCLQSNATAKSFGREQEQFAKQGQAGPANACALVAWLIRNGHLNQVRDEYDALAFRRAGDRGPQ